MYYSMRERRTHLRGPEIICTLTREWQHTQNWTLRLCLRLSVCSRYWDTLCSQRLHEPRAIALPTTREFPQGRRQPSNTVANRIRASAETRTHSSTRRSLLSRHYRYSRLTAETRAKNTTTATLYVVMKIYGQMYNFDNTVGVTE